MVLVSSRTQSPNPTPRRRARPTPQVPSDFRSRWLEPLRDLRLLILVGMILAYVWRFHDLTPWLNVLRISAILTVSSWIFLALHPRLARMAASVKLPFIAFYLLVIAWATVSAPFALVPERSWAELGDTHLKNVLFLLFFLTTVRSFKGLRLALAANVVGVGVLVFYYIKGGTPTEWTPVTMYDRNDLALLFNILFPIVLWFGFVQKKTWPRVGFFLLAAALGFAVLMSQSRGGFLGMACVLSFLAVTQTQIPVRARVAPVLLMVVGLFFLPAEVKERLSTLTEISEDYNVASPTGRIEIWKRGLGYIGEYPLLGVGLQNFVVAEETLAEARFQYARGWRGSVAHNSYIEIAAETGIPGLIFYLSMLVTAFFSLGRWKRRYRRFDDPAARSLIILADMLRASVVAFAAGAVFLSTFFLSSLVVLLGLVASYCIVSRDLVRRIAASRRPLDLLHLG